MKSFDHSVAVAIVVVSVAIASCGQPPATPSPAAASALPTPVVSQAELQQWIRFRAAYGLRFDLEWVISVANDAAASSQPYGVPLLPRELEQVTKSNLSIDRVLPIARAYAEDFPEFGGAWLELPRVVLGFAGDVTERRAEAAAIFGDKVIVREVQFALADLERFMAEIVADEAWFNSVGAQVVDIGVDEAMNAVQVHLAVPDETIERAARVRFDDIGWLNFTYDGPGPWTGPVGDLEISVVDGDGRPVAVACLVGSTDPRVQAETSMFAADGRCFFRDLAAVEWSIRVTYDVGPESLFAVERYVVRGGAVERATLVVGS